MDSDSGVSSGSGSHASTNLSVVPSSSSQTRGESSWRDIVDETVRIHASASPDGAVDDEPPPLATDSEWLTDSDEEEVVDNAASDNEGSLPSLRTLSDSSDSDVDDAHSDDSGWDDSEAEDDHELFNTIDAAAERASVRTGARQNDVAGEHPHIHPHPPNLDFLIRDYYAQVPRPAELLDLLLGSRPQPADNDPVRAQTLIAGLEVVPEELIGRYEQVRRGVTDDSDGCVICRDELASSYFTPPEDLCAQDEATVTAVLFAALPFHPSFVIMAFPCPGKHLFHRHCITPWLARKTTCPTCRFDIDPDSLTLRLSTSPRAGGSRTGARPERIWQPPRVSSFLRWLEREERIREGIADPSDDVKEVAPSIGEQQRGYVPVSSHLAVGGSDPDSEDEEDDWVDTDSDEPPVLASNPSPADNQDDLSRLLRDASLNATARSPAGQWQMRFMRSYAARPASHPSPSSNDHSLSSSNIHEAVLEDIFLRALHMGRSLNIASQLLTSPPSAIGSDRNAEEDEVPNPSVR
ncbi:hypothetical protein B0H21DRAFT_726139 [Amylocystis lapponica]|nr:hypothetical protein B0H21DRAFT_726139 [Amylocystis lapponica]